MKFIQKKAYFFFIAIVCTNNFLIQAYDTLHFYNATPFFQEPRFERDWLSSFDITMRVGSSGNGFNTEHQKVPLFDIYGTHNMKDLGVGVKRPDNDINNPLDIILTDLAALAGQGNFATLSIDGSINIFETYLHFVQNFKKGFFAEFHLPLRSIKSSKQPFVDLSPENGLEANKNSIQWQRFLTYFDDILKRYDLSVKPFDQTGAGDTTILFGWTHNYQETQTLDFIDVTLSAGIILPTSKKDDLAHICAVPFGYQGHFGFPFQARFAIGLYDWLTLGMYGESIFFNDKTTEHRIKTAETQRGIIKLQKETVTVDKGTLFNVGGYIKADHCVRGLSFLFGYSFTSSQDETLCPENSQKFDPSIVNSDEMLQGWNMHVLHFFAGYDFANECSWIGPRIGLYYDHIVSGKRIFRTHMFGTNAGIEVLWQF